jgi:hypothetical protein
MENTFDLKKFLVENKLTNNSKLLSENKVEGIDLALVRSLINKPEVQKLQDTLANNPQLAKQAAKVAANIVDGDFKAPENISEAFSPEEIKTAEELGVVRSKYDSDKAYEDMVRFANEKQGQYSGGKSSGPNAEYSAYHDNPSGRKEKDKTIVQILRSAGAGAALTTLIAPLIMAGTIGAGAAALPIVAAAVIVGALAGIGAGAAATDGFTRNSVIAEEDTDLAGQVQAIIDAGRRM